MAGHATLTVMLIIEEIKRPDGKKFVLLQFQRDEILNDLDQYGFVEGDVQRADAPHLKEARHQTQDITQDGNVDLVTRWLNLEHTRCRELLYPYSKIPVDCMTSLDDYLVDKEAYVIPLLVPGDFSQTTAEHLEELIHNLMVWRVLWRWFGITKPEAADKWLVSAAECEDEIKGALARLCRGVRRPLRPFS